MRSALNSVSDNLQFARSVVVSNPDLSTQPLPENSGSPFNQSPRPRRAIAIHYMTGAACFDQSGEHLMKQFVDLPDNAPMAEAGPHFPVVCRNGEPVGVPARLRVTG